AALLREMREIAAAGNGTRLWIVTENAQAIGPDARPDPESAALWGLGRTFALEHPDRWGGLIDLESGTDPEAADAQIAAALSAPAEDQVAFRSGDRLLARLVTAEAPPPVTLNLSGGAYLVTGGAGGLGLQVARWLAGHG